MAGVSAIMALVAGLLPSCIPAVRLRFVRVAATVGALLWALCVSGLMLAEVIPHLLPDIEAWGSHRGSGRRFG